MLMDYKINLEGDESYYMQLKNQIILAIASAELMEGDSLPSIRDMAELIGINMHTVNKAYSMLRNEGFLRLDRRGAFVCIPVDPVEDLTRLKASLRNCLAAACCSGISKEVIHKCVDDVLNEINGGN